MSDRHPRPPRRIPVPRRTVVKGAAALIGSSAAAALRPTFAGASTPAADVLWFVTTKASPWERRVAEATSGGGADVFVRRDAPLQAIEGFGACFNELGWTSLALDPELAFANPDGCTVVVIQNDLAEPLPVRIAIGDRVVAPVLPADSFSTLVVGGRSQCPSGPPRSDDPRGATGARDARRPRRGRRGAQSPRAGPASTLVASQDLDVGVPVDRHAAVKARLGDLRELRPSEDEPSVWVPSSPGLLELNFVGIDPVGSPIAVRKRATFAAPPCSCQASG